MVFTIFNILTLFDILKSYHGKLVYKSLNLIDIILSRFYYMLDLEINKNKKRLIKVQIYNQLREKILNGELKSGMRLLSSRELTSVKIKFIIVN